MFSAIILSLIFLLFLLKFFFSFKYIFQLFLVLPSARFFAKNTTCKVQPYRNNRNRTGLAQVMEGVLQSLKPAEGVKYIMSLS